MRRVTMLPFVALLVWLGAVAAVPARAEDERILHYASTIAIQADSTMQVTETITVRALNEQIRHGIYRDFPTTYTDNAGQRLVVGFHVTGATRDGRPEPYRLQSQSNGMRVYLGDANATVSRGTHTYTLTYTTDHQLGFFADHDELYWNVTGNGWIFPIDEATAVVTLPVTVARDKLRLEGYTGPRGAKGQDYRTWITDNGEMHFATTRALGAYEGLTIVASFPKGLVHKPTLAESVGGGLRDNPALLLAYLGLLLVLAHYWICWSMVGKDPPKGVAVPQWQPPSGLSPAAVRYLWRQGFDMKVLTAAVIDLAVKGYLVILEHRGSYTLVKKGSTEEARLREEYAKVDAALKHLWQQPFEAISTLVQAGLDDLSSSTRLATASTAPPPPTTAAVEEQALYKATFPRSDVLKLSNENYRTVQQMQQGVKDALRRQCEGILFSSNTGYFLAGVGLSGVLFLLTCLPALKGLVAANPVAPVFIFFMVVLTAVSAAVINHVRTRGFRGATPVAGILFLVFIIPNVLFGGIFAGVLGLSDPGRLCSALVVIFPVIGLVFLNVLFFHLLKAPSASGRKVLDALEGFRMYLSAAERDRLNLENPPEKTPALFEQFLPYALALDVDQQWSEQFSGVFAALHGSDGQYAPGWYAGSALSHFSAGTFASSMSNSLGSAISSSSSAPGSSSGSGGGGSSGGGGGGGGGGGW